jgi:tRNA(Ile)-lysidine synthase
LLRCDRYAIDGWAGLLEVFATERRGIAPHRLAHAEARGRAGGEQFLLQPAGVARSLKKQYQALGVPAEGRDGPLLYGGDGALLFAPGLGVDARVWAVEGAPQWGVRWLPAALACADSEG